MRTCLINEFFFIKIRETSKSERIRNKICIHFRVAKGKNRCRCLWYLYLFNQCFVSGMFIPGPDLNFSIPVQGRKDPGSGFAIPVLLLTQLWKRFSVPSYLTIQLGTNCFDLFAVNEQVIKIIVYGRCFCLEDLFFLMVVGIVPISTGKISNAAEDSVHSRTLNKHNRCGDRQITKFLV